MIEIYTDGGSRGNPGPAAIGVTILRSGDEVFSISKTIGKATNNEAEYAGLIAALEWLLEQEMIAGQEISLFMDSKLVVEQVRKNWKIKENRLRLMAEECWRLLERIEDERSIEVDFFHVSREKNARADELVNLALDA